MNLVFFGQKSNFFDLPIDAGFRFWLCIANVSSTSRQVIVIQEDCPAQEFFPG
jgi:hypothetical protein